MTNKEKLIIEIELAFENTAFPSNQNQSDTYGSEAEEINQLFSGKHWKEITDDFISQNTYLELAFMSEEAFCFFLPAYMIYALRYYKHDEDVESADHILQRTTFKLDDRTLIPKFSSSQISTITQFIEFAGKSWLFCFEKDQAQYDPKIARMLQMWSSFPIK
jgi:hypothetical protein